MAEKKTAAPKKPMTKAQVIAHFADTFEISKATAGDFLDELVKLAAKEAKKNGTFTIPGMGKVALTKRAARMGRNPATGETIKIAAKTVVKMRLSKSFQESIVPPKKAKK